MIILFGIDWRGKCHINCDRGSILVTSPEVYEADYCPALLWFGKMDLKFFMFVACTRVRQAWLRVGAVNRVHPVNKLVLK